MTPDDDARPHPEPDADASLHADVGGHGGRTSRRRRHAVERRSRRVRFFVDDTEQTLLAAAATDAGMSVGAWVATTAVTAARAARAAPGTSAPSGGRGQARSIGTTMVEAGELLRRLVETRDQATAAWRQLRIVGGLLNQVATVGNSTGELPPNTDRVLERVVRATERLDSAGVELRAVATACRGLLP